MLIDLKSQYFITGMKIRGPGYGGYNWDAYPPSYSLEFSNDNKTFYSLYQENKSTRITNETRETEYFFETKGYFRYFRLRETDLAEGRPTHGQYMAWLDFYIITNFCSDFYQSYSHLELINFLVIILQ